MTKAVILDAIEAEFNTSVQGVPFVGDHVRDIRAGLIKGCVPYLVRTGRGTEFEPLLQQGVAAEGTLPAVEARSEEHTSELQSRGHLVCRLLLEKKKKKRPDASYVTRSS